MKKLFLLSLISISFPSFAQTYRTVDAPVGFLRDEPKVTAAIIFRLEEKARVKVIQQINKTWLKVEYKHNSTSLVGYITNHTLDEKAITKKKAYTEKETSI